MFLAPPLPVCAKILQTLFCLQVPRTWEARFAPSFSRNGELPGAFWTLRRGRSCVLRIQWGADDARHRWLGTFIDLDLEVHRLPFHELHVHDPGAALVTEERVALVRGRYFRARYEAVPATRYGSSSPLNTKDCTSEGRVSRSKIWSPDASWQKVGFIKADFGNHHFEPLAVKSPFPLGPG